MKKFNPEYDIPKLKNIFTVLTVIVWLFVQMFHWKTAEFASEVMITLVCVWDAVSAWIEKKRGSAIFWCIMAIAWFALAVRSFLKYNI